MSFNDVTNHSHPLNLGMQFFAEGESPVAEPSSTPAAPAAAEPSPSASPATAEPSPAVIQPTKPGTVEPAKPAEPRKYKINVLGVEKEISDENAEEITKLLQKGSDYDRIRIGYDFAKELAAKSGQTDVPAFIESYRNTISEAEKAEITKNHSEKVAQLEAVGYPHELAEEQVTALEDAAISKKERDAQKKNEQIKKSQEEEKAAQVARMNALTAKYPEVVKDGKLSYPQEALEIVGKFLDNRELAGYEIYQKMQRLDSTEKELAQLKAVNAADTANSSNAAASIGNVAGNAAVEKDVYTSEEWDALPMSKRVELIKSNSPSYLKSVRSWGKK